MTSRMEIAARVVRLPEVLSFLLYLKSNLVAASCFLLMLHRADHSCKAIDAFDQRILIFPLRECE